MRGHSQCKGWGAFTELELDLTGETKRNAGIFEEKHTEFDLRNYMTLVFSGKIKNALLADLKDNLAVPTSTR